MDILFLHTLFISFINLVGIYLCFLVYFSSQRKTLRYIFICMMVSMFMWVDFAYLARVYGQSDYLPLFFLRIAWFITPVFFTLLYFFTIDLIDEHKEHRRQNMAVAITGFLLAVVCGMTDLVVNNIQYVDKNITIIYGAGKVPFFLVVFMIMCATLVPLFSKFRKIPQKEKTKFQYFLIGIFIFYAANAIFNILLPAFLGIARFYYLGDYSTIFFLMLTAYAITRRELLDIKTFFVETAVFVISMILLFDIVFLSTGFIIRVVKIAVLLAFLYFSEELIKSVQREDEAKEKIERAYLFLEERNQDLHILLEASNRMNQHLDSKKISQDIVDSIPKSLKYLGYIMGVIVLYNPKKDCVYVYAATESALVRKMEKHAKVSIKEFREHFSENDDFIIRTIKNGRICASDRMKDFFGGFMEEAENAEAQNLLGAKSFVSIPLFSSGQATGAIIFANAKKMEHITERSKDIVQAFASHIGSSIENAQLYEKTDYQMKELAKLNRNLKKANAKLEELLKMKNEFLHITSHQLRTPLTAIRGMISMWVDGDFDKLGEEKKQEMLQRIYVSAERLDNVTNDMLDALEWEGRILKLDFKKISVVEMLKDTIATLKPDYEKKGLYLNLKAEGEISQIEADPNYMSQVFMNLVDNACKYTRTGGVDITVGDLGKYVTIKIKDTGIGMEPADVEKAFEKFTRGKNAMAENASGSGLGLFIVKKIIDEHNGEISVASELEKGTTFTVSLLKKQE